MEFPDLGKHCSEESCKQWDFLPFECDACKQVFCKSHFTCDRHKCGSVYRKDVQVPVCPMCNSPVPVKKGETPDIVIGEHIARKCKPDPARRKQKIFKNKCLKPGCKRKELIQMVCDHCQDNFCIQHRYPLDHDCRGIVRAISKAGHAAIMRAQESSVTRSKEATSETSRHPQSQPMSASLFPQSCGMSYMAAWQNGLSEEEVLKRVLELSLTETNQHTSQALSSQEEDRASSEDSLVRLDASIETENKKKTVTSQ